MPTSSHLQVQQQQQGGQKSFLGSLFQLAAPFVNAEVPGLGTAMGAAGSMMNGGSGQGMGQGIMQLSGLDKKDGGGMAPGTPPIQPPENATPPSQPNSLGHEDAHQPPPKVEQPGMPPEAGGAGAGGQSGGASGGGAAQPDAIPDPIKLQRDAAVDAFIQEYPELFASLRQNPHHLDGMLNAMGALKQRLGGVTA